MTARTSRVGPRCPTPVGSPSGRECTRGSGGCPVPSARDVDQDLRHHQRGGRAPRRRPRRRRARLHVRAGQPAPGHTRRPWREILHRLPAGVITVGRVPRRDEGAGRRDREHARPRRRAAPRARAAVRRPLDPQAGAVRDPGASPPATPRSPRSATARSTSCSSTPTNPARAPCSTGRSPTPCPPGCGSCSPAGCNGENVAQAIRRVRPWGVDVVAPVSRPRPARVARTPASCDASSRRRATAGEQLGGSDGWVPDPEAAPYDWMADGA